MPWEKNFDVQEARIKAMEVFWSKGMVGTSMAHLLEHMGIHRGSFYATFRSKKALFLEALRQYIQLYLAPVLQGAGGLEAREAVAQVFEAFFEASTGPDSGRGCFLVNSSLELGKQDDEVDAILQATVAKVEGFFLQKIQDAQQKGALSQDLRAQEVAGGLTALLFGMRTLERAGASESMLRAIPTQAEMLLGS